MKMISLFLLIINTSIMACPTLELESLQCVTESGREYQMDYISLQDNKLRFKVFGIETGYDLPLQEQFAGVTKNHYCFSDEVVTEELFSGNFTRSTMYMDGESLRILGTEIITRCTGQDDDKVCSFSGFRSVDVKCTPSL